MFSYYIEHKRPIRHVLKQLLGHL